MATQQTASTLYIDVNGVQISYRRLGLLSGIPTILLTHFRGNMDSWDPALINRLAESRPIILFDNAGVGRSGGEIPLTFVDWAEYGIGLIQALNLKQVDVLGFSMGGCVAQMLALNAPAGLVRRTIFASTRASANEALQAADQVYIERLASSDEQHYSEAHALSIFNNDDKGQKAAHESWARINERNLETSKGEEHMKVLDKEGGFRQIAAYLHFMGKDNDAILSSSFSRLHELKMPVLVANGDNDLLIPSADSWNLVNNIEHAHLHIYPQSGHGFLYQHAHIVAQHFNSFLDGDWDK
jgi:pimeloyl-ACP methyl ester carboxylesterase